MVKQEAGRRSSIHYGWGVPGVWGCCTRGDVFAESTWGDGLAFVGLLVGWAGDNKAALSLCKDHKEGQRVKHIDVIHHFACDHVASGELSFVCCKSVENVSDCSTKALSRPLFEKGSEGLGMIST
jgi:hypothetical protein